MMNWTPLERSVRPCMGYPGIISYLFVEHLVFEIKYHLNGKGSLTHVLFILVNDFKIWHVVMLFWKKLIMFTLIVQIIYKIKEQYQYQV